MCDRIAHVESASSIFQPLRKTTMKNAFSLQRAFVLLGVVLLACGLATPLAPAGNGNDDNPRVLPVNSKPYGLTYGEWSARHWQWLLSLPLTDHPLFGDDGDSSAGLG